MLQLLETIKCVGNKLINLEWHQKRVLYSQKALFPGFPHLQLSDIVVPTNLDVHQTYKCRVIYSTDILNIEFTPYAPKEINTLQIVYSETICYNHKYADRTAIQLLSEGKRDASDILIVKNGQVTDTSIANIAFYNEGKWYTPDTPLLNGTCRERLIAQRLLIPTPILLENIHSNFSHFIPINALIEFDIMNIKPITNILK